MLMVNGHTTEQHDNGVIIASCHKCDKPRWYGNAGCTFMITL